MSAADAGVGNARQPVSAWLALGLLLLTMLFVTAAVIAGLPGPLSAASTSLTAISFSLAGMSAMATAVSFLASLSGSRSSSLSVRFNTSRVLAEIPRGPVVEGEFREVDQPQDPWELRLEGLLAIDRQLALAKLRMDLEQELRKLAYQAKLPPGRPSTSAVILARNLAEHGVLTGNLLPPLLEVISACNKAIHGYEISDSTAWSVVQAGKAILAELRSVSENLERLGERPFQN